MFHFIILSRYVHTLRFKVRFKVRFKMRFKVRFKVHFKVRFCIAFFACPGARKTQCSEKIEADKASLFNIKSQSKIGSVNAP
jgi:hypothetical protein